jgi:hypothetical protein
MVVNAFLVDDDDAILDTVRLLEGYDTEGVCVCGKAEQADERCVCYCCRLSLHFAMMRRSKLIDRVINAHYFRKLNHEPFIPGLILIPCMVRYET